MGCNISVGQGKEFIRPNIDESQSQFRFFDSSFTQNKQALSLLVTMDTDEQANKWMYDTNC